ncbi:unnamed protein product [Caenorhabditis brenneri]
MGILETVGNAAVGAVRAVGEAACAVGKTVVDGVVKVASAGGEIITRAAKNTFYSKEENESDYKVEYLNRLAAHDEKIRSIRQQKTEEIKRKHKHIVPNAEREMENELKAESSSHELLIQQQMAELAEKKKRCKREFLEFKRNLEAGKDGAVFSDEAVIMSMKSLEERKGRNEEEKKMMLDMMKDLKKLQLNKIQDAQNHQIIRQKMLAEQESRQNSETRDFQAKMLKLAEETEAQKLRNERMMKEVADKSRDRELKFLDEQWKLGYSNLNSRKALMEAAASDAKLNEFRFELQNITALFNKFKTTYTKEELTIMMILSEMKNKKKIRTLPEVTLIGDLSIFTNAIENLDIVDNRLELEAKEIVRKSNELRSDIETLWGVITSYNPKRHDKDNSYETAQMYSVEINNLVEELGNLVMQFKVLPTESYETAFEKQWSILMPSTYSLENGRNVMEITGNRPLAITNSMKM